jgi:phosphate transport system permease protein
MRDCHRRKQFGNNWERRLSWRARSGGEFLRRPSNYRANSGRATYIDVETGVTALSDASVVAERGSLQVAQRDHAVVRPASREPHPIRRSRNVGDLILRIVTTGAGASVLVVLAIMIAVMVWSSRGAVAHYGLSLLSVPATGEVPFTPNSAITGTIYSSVLALLMAGPIGLLIAIFLAEISHGRLSLPLGFIIEFLAAIPSIVYGLWALFVLVPLVRQYLLPTLILHFGNFPLFANASPTGFSLLTASMVLAVMIVPTIATLSRDVMVAVPRSQREAMLALGATRWEVIWKVVVPYARGGIIGSVVLGLGRAIGETMAVQMVIGNNIMATGATVLNPATTIPAILVNQFNDSTGLYRETLLELALILLLIAVALNAMARGLVWTVDRKYSA